MKEPGIRKGDGGFVSPLDPEMWSVDAIASVWDRRDPLTASGLLSRANVSEWVSSTSKREIMFTFLVERVVNDLRCWGVEPRGIFPSGVGGYHVSLCSWRAESGGKVGG